MNRILSFSIILLALLLTGCNGGPGAKEYITANAAYARGDYQTAFENYLYAANQGVTPAEYAVGYQYYYGLGVKKDIPTAILWFRQAAPHSKQAQYALNLIRQNQTKEPWLMNLNHL